MKTLDVYSRDIVDNRARKTYSVRMNYSANDRSCEITPSNSQPVTQSERIGSIDTLRGFALLGILLLNIIAFSGPLAAYYDPSVNNDISGLNLAVAMFVDIWAEGAFRAIFSMLFGAGFLIFFEKSNVDKRTLKLLYYRRTFILIGFGLINAYVLLWVGDILYAYGVTGLFLYFFKDLSANKLALCSLALFVFIGLLHAASYFTTESMFTAYQEVLAIPNGVELSDAQNQTLENWDSYLQAQLATPEQIAIETTIRDSGYIENFIFTAQINIVFQTVIFLFSAFWDAAAMMLLGMAFMKWNIFDASRDLSFYIIATGLGFGVGLIVNSWEIITYVTGGFEPSWAPTLRPTYDIGRLAMAVGYIGVVMICCKMKLFSKLLQALACVGQMALTNYLSQTIICNIIFLGFGFGLWGKLQRFEIYIIVLGIWILQLIYSVVWLKKYRFGPAEWLWRSLTYRKRQPLRKIANQV